MSNEEYESLLNNIDEVEWEKDEDRGDHHFYWFMITGEWNRFLTQKFSDYSTMGHVIIGTYDAVDEALICDGIGMFKDYHTEEIRDERIIKLLKLKIRGYELFGE